MCITQVPESVGSKGSAQIRHKEERNGAIAKVLFLLKSNPDLGFGK